MEIIAEIGQNHNGDPGLARELIHAAKENGADVAKFQLYDAPSLFPKQGNEWFEYNCKTQLSREQLVTIADECRNVGIEFMASVFDVTRVAWLESVKLKRYKIASRSVRDTELIQAIADTGKPMLVSLGMWEEPEFPLIDSAAPVQFLYCISQYPTQLENLRFSSIDFTRYSGFSDHTIGITGAIVAFSRGAKIVEKHFTLNKKMKGPDHACSMTPTELNELNRFRTEIARCLG